MPRKCTPLIFIRDIKERPDLGKVILKEYKGGVETKEEKFAPAETKDYSLLSVRALSEEVGNMSEEDLKELQRDVRVSARKLATDELKRRGN